MPWATIHAIMVDKMRRFDAKSEKERDEIRNAKE